MKIETIEHVPFEGPAAIADWAEDRGHEMGRTLMFREEPLPPVGQVDLLVVMGGPMGVFDESLHPWLAREKEYIRLAIESGCSILGVCLGAQLLADTLGATVARNPEKEIGWFPVESTLESEPHPLCGTLPDRFTAFHWHGDTFTIPPGATRLARSEACENQGFAVDARLVGLQFHLETTAESMESIIANGGDDLSVKGPFVQPVNVMREGLMHQSSMRSTLDGLLDAMAAEAVQR